MCLSYVLTEQGVCPDRTRAMLSQNKGYALTEHITILNELYL